MSLPFDSDHASAAEGSNRNFTGWIAVAVLVAFVMVMSSGATSKAKPNRFEGHEAEQTILKEVMSAQSLEKAMGGPLQATQTTTAETLSKTLDEPISSLVLESDTDPLAAMLYAEMRTFQKRDVPIGHLKVLTTSKFPEDRAFYAIYTAPKLTKQQAEDLIAKLPKQPFVYQAAKVQALEKAGDKNAVNRIVSPVTSVGTVILALLSWPFIGASMAVWMVFSRRSREGKLDPKGIPLDEITDLDADRLAIRAAQIFALFIAMGGLALALSRGLKLNLNDSEIEALGGVFTVASLFWLQRIPVDGKRITFELLGVSLKNWKKDVFLGIVGFLAEFPMTIILAELSAVILRFLPKATHPAAEALEHSHELRTVIPVLIAGAIIAPFWEEIVFRGLLFPGLKRLLGGIVPGIALSSFLFASVHSQGVTLWLPLAFVGATSCYLSHQSRSLVPGMVMHCLHNTALFVMILLS